jgi:hypothetical protein
MVKPQNKSQIPNSNEEKMQVSMEMIKYFSTKEGGMVIVYKVTPPSDEILDEFYIVTFDDTAGEYVWGVGYDEEEALKDAKFKWDLKSQNEEEKEDNPFEEVLEVIKND